MQSPSSRIWTRVAVSISNDVNYYTQGTSKIKLGSAEVPPILCVETALHSQQRGLLAEHSEDEVSVTVEKWNRKPEFKPRTGMFTFHFVQSPSEKQEPKCSVSHIWINSRIDGVFFYLDTTTGVGEQK